MSLKSKKFNIIISGVGGQGLITLLQIISEAALLEDYDVKTSELHGLSQRGGSVEVHIRFGKKIYSSLIPQGKADLIIALESQEALSSAYFASKNSVFLINKYQIPTLTENILPEKTVELLEKISQKVILIPAVDICQREVGTPVTSGIYLLGYAVSKKLIPLSLVSILKAIRKVIPEKYLELNLKTFEKAISF